MSIVWRDKDVVDKNTFSAPPREVTSIQSPLIGNAERASLFDKHYFNGGKKVGGYAGAGFADFPVHWIHFRHLLERNPSSVLEVGAARGYIGKRLQDAAIPWLGLEISAHCHLTRAADPLVLHDVCAAPWPVRDQSYDLCYSTAVLEHVPEQFLPAVISEMKRTCRRALHGIDFGHNDDGFDKTHCTLRPKEWWTDLFDRHWSLDLVEIVDKEELSRGEIPPHVLGGDGKTKIAIGTFTLMSHFNWLNVDIHDLSQFAAHNRYRFQRVDVRNGLPFSTSSVDLMHLSHVLEHFSYDEGLRLLKECRRVVRKSGAIRIAVPDLGALIDMYRRAPDGRAGHDHVTLAELDEINDGAEACATAASKMWALLFSGHFAGYDYDTLRAQLAEAGFSCHRASFRKTEVAASQQILRECLDVLPCLSLFVDATVSEF